MRVPSILSFLTRNPPAFRTTPTSSFAFQSPLTALRGHDRTFTTTLPSFAMPGKGGISKSKKQSAPRDPRVSLIRYHLLHPKTPRPLRFSRNRSLRHWTVHRAWLLFRRNKAKAEELELQRMYKSMHDACEELRLLEGPDQKIGSRLYRIAMEKRGVFRPGGVPIEYARGQTETPGREPWNHGWTR